jgi:ubiquinone/menaquinone biosynthesis C-methylase UbiE
MSPSDAPGATLAVAGMHDTYSAGQILNLEIALRIDDICLFDPVFRLFVRRAGEYLHLLAGDTHQGRMFYPWLPRGDYEFGFAWPVSLPPGEYELGLAWGSPRDVRPPDFLRRFTIVEGAQALPSVMQATWRVRDDTAQRIAALSWQKGMENWFHRHFCHAALVIAETFLKNAPQLRGRILDIGAGDGITDLSLFLRFKPQEMVLIDIVDYAAKLTETARLDDLPLERLPDGFTFVQGSCEAIPYPDQSFDLVLSWGSVEHIKGGYRKALDEVWRVLKPGGLFFVNPGLIYSTFGSHLGEFSDEPHLHLKISEQALHDLVMTSQPKRMDRAGFDVSNAEYWRFYKELNHIRVADFEAELKAYGYEVVRAALRTNDCIEYSPQLQAYSILDLGVEDAFFTLRKPA